MRLASIGSVLTIQKVFIEEIAFDESARGIFVGNKNNGASGIVKYGSNYYFNKTPFSIYKVDTDFTFETAIYEKSEGFTVRDINVIEDWIFFAENGIYRMTTDGKKLRQLYIGIT